MRDAPFKLLQRAFQLNEENFAAVGLNNPSDIPNKAALNSAVEGKCEDQTSKLRRNSLGEDRKPDRFSQLNERLTAKLEDRFDQVNRQMVMENSKLGELCELTPDSQFSDAWQTVKKDELQCGKWSQLALRL